MSDDTKGASLFFITPIGHPQSAERTRADAVFSLLETICSELGVTPIRADREAMPGQISVRILQDIVESTVCVADLVGSPDAPNPNVMYELGLADMAKKHVVLLYSGTERLPFDVQDVRAHALQSSEYIDVVHFEGELRDAVAAALEAAQSGVGPVSMVTHLEGRYELERRFAEGGSDGPELARVLGAIDDRLSELEHRLRSVEANPRVNPYSTSTSSRGQEDERPPVAVDASLEAILQELKARGIGRR